MDSMWRSHVDRVPMTPGVAAQMLAALPAFDALPMPVEFARDPPPRGTGPQHRVFLHWERQPTDLWCMVDDFGVYIRNSLDAVEVHKFDAGVPDELHSLRALLQSNLC